MDEDEVRMDEDAGAENEDVEAVDEGMIVAEQPLRIEAQPVEELVELLVLERNLNNEDESDWSSDHSGSDSSSSEDLQSATAGLYEISRSSRHEYLGDTEIISSRTVFSDDDLITIPVLSNRAGNNLVLLPNQSLPLTVFCPMQQSMLRHVISRDKIIGIIKNGQRVAPHQPNVHLEKFGTTAEIQEIRMPDSNSGLSLLARGRQRFKVVETRREVTGLLMATVKILPEIRMGDPLRHVLSPSHMKHNCRRPAREFGQKLLYRNPRCIRSKSSWRLRKLGSLLTPQPWFVYDQYDSGQLMVRIINDIVTRSNALNTQTTLEVPSGRQGFSHWASANLPINDAQRIKLLSVHTSEQRMRFLLNICNPGVNNGGLYCTNCNVLTGKRGDIICMSTEGSQATFVNPDGFVHEMITVSRVLNVTMQGSRDDRHSWFPGYTWRIANCSQCSCHIGWEFKAKENLKPKIFYGITRNSVKAQILEEFEDDEYLM